MALINIVPTENKANPLDTYPVGAIYISTANTSPATLFGGSWIQIKDTFLLCAGSTYAAGTTGGEASHTLTVDEMPSHNHRLTTAYPNESGASNMPSKNPNAYGGSSTNSAIQATGGSQPHNNMPPYLAVYVWKRTA